MIPHQMADMQTVRGAVVTDIGDELTRAETLVERLDVCALMDIAAFERGGEKGGARCRHDCVI